MGRQAAVVALAFAIWEWLPVGECGGGRLLDPAPNGLFHTIFPVECRGDYLLWQSIGLWHSFQKINQPGSFTRLLACAEEEREAFRKTGAMDLMPTHVTPSYTNYHPGDSYGPVRSAQCCL
jgi:hypothetical protein